MIEDSRKGFPENVQLEMPKEEATFDPFSTHVIPENLNITEMKRFENVFLEGGIVCFH